MGTTIYPFQHVLLTVSCWHHVCFLLLNLSVSMMLCDFQGHKRWYSFHLWECLFLEPNHYATRKGRNHMERPWVGVWQSPSWGPIQQPALIYLVDEWVHKWVSLQVSPAQAFDPPWLRPGGAETSFPSCPCWACPSYGFNEQKSDGCFKPLSLGGIIHNNR